MKNLLVYICLVFIFVSISCSNRVVSYSGKGRVVYNSGKFKGYDYYRIKTKTNFKTNCEIGIFCNDYIRGIGKTYTIYKYEFLQKGTFKHYVLFRDSAMVKSYKDLLSESSTSPKILSFDEVNMITNVIMYFPKFATQYKIEVDSIKNSLGWLEM